MRPVSRHALYRRAAIKVARFPRIKIVGSQHCVCMPLRPWAILCYNNIMNVMHEQAQIPTLIHHAKALGSVFRLIQLHSNYFQSLLVRQKGSAYECTISSAAQHVETMFFS